MPIGPDPDRSVSRDPLTVPVQDLPAGYWIGTAAAVIITAGVLAWACFGTVSTRIYGQGVLVAAGETVGAIETTAVGIVRELKVQPGDWVKAGQVIATLHVQDIEADLRTSHLRVRQIEDDARHVKTSSDDELRRRQQAFTEQKSSLEVEKQRLEATYARLTAQLAKDEVLMKQGLTRAPDLEASRRNHDNVVIELSRNRAALSQAQSDLLDYQDRTAERVRQVEQAYREHSLQLDELRERHSNVTVVRAPQDARVIEVRVGRGDLVQPGTVVATLTVGGGEAGYEVLAFLSAAQGPRARPGMPAHVIPSTVKKEEYGSIRSAVVDVQPRPVSEAEVNSLIRNPTLSSRFTAMGPPIVSRLSVASSATASGLAWWAGSGPSFEIRPGTICAIEIEVSSQRPISLIIPALREMLGV